MEWPNSSRRSQHPSKLEFQVEKNHFEDFFITIMFFSGSSPSQLRHLVPLLIVSSFIILLLLVFLLVALFIVQTVQEVNLIC